MSAFPLLIATACSLAVAGASGVAFAQTTTLTAPNQVQTQGQNLDQLQGQTTITTVREGTTPGRMNSTTTPEATTTGTYGTTGTAATGSADGTQRSAQNRVTMDTERAAHADRNSGRVQGRGRPGVERLGAGRGRSTVNVCASRCCRRSRPAPGRRCHRSKPCKTRA